MIWILTFPHAEAWGDSTRGDTELISVSVDFPAIPRIRNTSSYNPSISHDGLRVAFDSDAPDLVENDANGQIADVFLRDRVQSATTIISASSSGVQGNAGSYDPAITSDGRFVAFASWASNLVDGDTNDTYDVFVRDTATVGATRVSLDADGLQIPAGGRNPSISDNGRFVAFVSDTCSGGLCFGSSLHLFDAAAGTSRLIASGGFNDAPSISADGRFLAFESSARLVPEATGRHENVYVFDLVTSTFTLVSEGTAGGEANDYAFGPDITPNGRYVAFWSWASNLVDGDNNDNCWRPVGITSCPDVFVRDLQTETTTLVSLSSSGA